MPRLAVSRNPARSPLWTGRGDEGRQAPSKALVAADCAIDFFAGPSEILILSSNGRPAWIGKDAIDSMSPAKAAQARNYNAGVGRNWKRAPVEDRKSVV